MLEALVRKSENSTKEPVPADASHFFHQGLPFAEFISKDVCHLSET